MSTSYEEEERRRLVSKTETEPEPQDDEKPEPSLAPHPDPDARGAREHTARKYAYEQAPPPTHFAHLSCQGGKWNIGKEFLAAMIEAHRERPGQTYIEPFVGGANILWKISGKRIASDLHPRFIDFWKSIQSGWYPDPPNPTLDQYNVLKVRYKHEKDFSHLTREECAQIAWTGYAASDRGAWFGGFAHSEGGAKTRNVDQQIPEIQNVKFKYGGYGTYSQRKGCLIYCDPPYKGKKKYVAVGKFDTPKFWDWASKMARKNTVLVSEATLPDDRHIEDTEPYMAGPYRDRQEYLILVRASRA